MTYHTRLFHRTFNEVLLMLIVLSLIFVISKPVWASEASQLDITASVTGTNADMVNSILGNASMLIKTSEKDDAFLMNLDTYVSGNDVMSLLLEITREKISFSLPITNNSKYEFTLAKLSELFQKTYGIAPGIVPGTDIENGLTLPSWLSLSSMIPEEITEEAVTVLTPYVQYLMNTVLEGLQEEAGVVTLSHLGIVTDGSILSWEPDGAQLAGIFTQLAEMVEKDAAAKDFVDTIAASIVDPEGLGALISQIANSSGQNIYPQELQEMSSSLTEGFASLPALLRNTASSLSGSTQENSYFRIEECKVNSIPCKYSLRVGSDEEIMFTGGIEMDPEKPDLTICLYGETPDQEYSLTFDNEYTEDGLLDGSICGKMFSIPVFTLSYTMDTMGLVNGANGAVSDAEIESDNETDLGLGINLPNSFSSGLTLKAASLDVVGVMLSLTMPDEQVADSPARISIRGIGVPDDPVGITGADIVATPEKIDAADLEAPVGETVDISNYDIDDLANLFSRLGETIAQSVASSFMPAQ